MEPKLSIIVPIYNLEDYLEKCVNSILNQTFKDFELILINDGSFDSSGIICDRYTEKDTRVKVIHCLNGGPSKARNIGLEISRGEYIGFVDGDDWIEHNMYKTLYEACAKDNSDIGISGLREVDELGNIISEYIPHDVSLTDILRKAYPCNKIFKKRLFTENNLFFIEGKYYEDLELIPKLFVMSNKISTIKELSYNYLKRKGSTTSSRDEKILDNLWAYVQIRNYLINEKIYIKYSEEFENAVKYFKKYYINILYDYPTSFLIKHKDYILEEFSKIGGLKLAEILTLLFKHLKYRLRKIGSISKNKIGKIVG
ncbi:glycosyltransferase family 2 protein [Mesobacillus subterraneus]|uniref:glycosyltransferase family 2 protein n=1 Tax=Mesobacillus subterraneus TaxID=285983 RepID=UPI001CFD1EA6|nr:glycosyltransferase [Mesobacillus subterraneus]